MRPVQDTMECRRDTSILYIMLMLGTLAIGLTLYNFRKVFLFCIHWCCRRFDFAVILTTAVTFTPYIIFVLPQIVYSSIVILHFLPFV